MKRDFLPIKDYPVYNDAVDRFMRNSKIFNFGNEQIQRTFWSRGSIETKLYEIENSLIPIIEVKVKDIEDSFEDYKQKRIRIGREEPLTMPEPMLTDYYWARAQLTVLRGELEELQKWLHVYTDHDKEVEDSKVLEYGLRGHGVFHGTRATNPDLVDVLREIDGQKCTLSPEGILYIDDARSCFNLLYVADYHRLVREWQEKRKKAEDKKFLLLQEQYREQGLPKPLPSAKAPVKISKSSLPPFPTWGRKYSPETDES